ncbi:hypothetical protein N9355_03080 [Crocinitomicaceae bacterium]|nr:hypothetical protein [Crocinitomicaceae bacterium]
MHLLETCIVAITATLLSFTTAAQCDSSVGNYAKPGTYEVHYNPELTENQHTPSRLANCDYLLQIESARREDKDVLLEIDNYLIVVTSRKRLMQMELENSAQ